MRLTWRRSKPTGDDPARAHSFRETDDAGIGAISAGGPFRTGSTVTSLAMTTAVLRGTRCALSGCGKPREDPIHAPEDRDG